MSFWNSCLKSGQAGARLRRSLAGFFRKAQVWDKHHGKSFGPAEIRPSLLSLTQLSRDLENSFLRNSHHLETLARQGEMFIENSEKLVSIATGQHQGTAIFYSTMKIIETPLNSLSESHARIQSLLERLKTDNKRISALVDVHDDIERAMAPLKHIQILFKIQSAPLGEEVQAMFSALTQEIEKLHSQVREIFSIKFQELDRIQRTVAEVIVTLQSQTTALGLVVTRERAQIQKSLEHLQAKLEENQQRESGIGKLGKLVSGEIQRVVMGLQFQDIVNQKLQHASEALEKLGDSSNRMAGWREQVCHLQARQIQGVIDDLQGAERSVKDGIGNVLTHIEGASSDCLSLREFEQLTTSADGMVQTLLDILGSVRRQTAEMVACSSRAFEILRPIGGLASDLTQVVYNLSQRIHLIGLNAQVQAAQVQQGVGLEVLSAHTSEVSLDTNRISRNVAAQLDQLVGGLTETVRDLESVHASALEQHHALGEAGDKAEAELHGLRDVALSSLAEVGDVLERIRTESRSLLTDVDFVQVAEAPLRELLQRLNDASAQAGPGGFDLESQSGEVLEELRQGYTMASERRVFANLVSRADSQTSEADESTVELFGSDETSLALPMPEPAPPPRKPVPTVASSVSAPPPSTPPPPAAPASVNLGDNVELF